MINVGIIADILISNTCVQRNLLTSISYCIHYRTEAVQFPPPVQIDCRFAVSFPAYLDICTVDRMRQFYLKKEIDNSLL